MLPLKKCLPFLFLLSGVTFIHAAELEIPLERTNFYRDERPGIKILVKGDLPKKSSIEVTLGNHSIYRAPAKKGEMTIRLSSHQFRSGEYPFTIRIVDSEGKEVANQTVPIGLAKRPARDALHNWLWSGGGGVLLDWKFYQEHGFDYTGGPMLPYRFQDHIPDVDAALEGISKNLNDSLPKGMLVSGMPNGGIWKRPFSLFKPEGEDIEYQNARAKGEDFYNPFSLAVAEKQNEANRRFMDAVAKHPNFTLAWVDMEIQDYLTQPNLNKEGREKMVKELGFSVDEVGEPQYVAKNVIADDDRMYRMKKYVYQGGNGVHLALERMVKAVKEARPDILTMTDPYRDAPLYRLYPSVDIIHSWIYTNPDPKNMIFIEQMRTACAPLKQIPLQIVTLLNYPGKLDPSKEWMAMAEDRVKETTWINLSRAPQMVGYFYGSQIDPVKYVNETHRIPHETSDAIKEMAEKVFKPYGRMIRKLDVSKRKMAVLTSYAASIYNRSAHESLGGYGAYRTIPFQILLEMAHYSADVVFDETIEQGGLDRYDVLFLPRCDTLTQTVVEKIKAFQKRGGRVFADQHLGPELELSHQFNFDFAYRRNVDARANISGQAYADWDDHAEKEGSKVTLEKVVGIPAHRDQEIMEGYAQTLRKTLGEKGLKPVVSSDTPTVLFNLCEKSGAQYLFVINDKREYDERSGKYQGMMERSIPQTVNVLFRDDSNKDLVAYDLIKKRKIDLTRNDDGYKFPVELDKLGGTIIGFYPHEFKEVIITAAPKGRLGKSYQITIEIKDANGKNPKGLQPVRVDLQDANGKPHEDSDWICLENGKATFTFTPALNDTPGDWILSVSDLTAGLSTQSTVHYR